MNRTQSFASVCDATAGTHAEAANLRACDELGCGALAACRRRALAFLQQPWRGGSGWNWMDVVGAVARIPKNEADGAAPVSG